MNAREIITKAIELHATEFRAAMIAQAEIHDNTANLARHPQAKRGAESQRAACLNVYDAIAGGLDNIEGAIWTRFAISCLIA